jgi:S-(hydroxymethyl)glutathione dehydrogenase/alcohol dehydrogenase
MKAVVYTGPKTFSVEEVSLDPPKAGELKIAMAATGVCHSDLSVVGGVIPLPPPMVLGHEGAGVVEEIGEGVRGYEVGDHVVLSFVPACGRCPDCLHQRPTFCTAGEPNGLMLDGTSRVRLGDQAIGVMQFLGCMAEHAVVPATSAVKIDPAIPLDRAALIGCGVMTGVGAAINTAGVTPGSTCAVFGCGGIGLSIVQGCRIAGADRIIGVDVADHKLELARSFGATDLVNGSDGGAVARVQELTGGGADFAFEAVGSAALMGQTYDAVRRAGTAVIVGAGPVTESFPMNALLVSTLGKTLKGSLYGDANPHADFPMLLSLYQRGKLDLDGMITNTYSIEEAPQAFADLEKGLNARGVIVY